MRKLQFNKSRGVGQKNEIGDFSMTPKNYRSSGTGESIAYACRDTSLGYIMMAATMKGVCCVQFGNDMATLLAQLQVEFPKASLIAVSAQYASKLDAWIEALDAYISRSAPRPDLPLDMRGTEFQMKVWRALLTVSEGHVISYGELAVGIEHPKAVRAVASACAANRIGVLVPCHRVVRSDGGLGGYRWGLDRKMALLDAERLRNTASP